MVRVGVLILPEDRWTFAARKWRTAESLGFDHAWTYDHLAWRSLRDSPWFAAIPTLTAAALVTDGIRLGTLVASPNFRHPVSFARELISLDDISQGRLTLGLGSGGEGWDATMFGRPPWSLVERIERFEEFVELLDQLLSRPETSFNGHYYNAVEARTYPGCTQRPRIPFAVAATGPRAMRIAARHASVWVTNGDRSHRGPPLGPAEGAEVVRRQGAVFDEVCATERRDPTTIDRLVLTGARLDSGLQSRQAFDEVKEAYAAVGTTDLVVHWPRDTEPYAGDESVLHDILG
jgi:alkanesulfonate monooxygenase SsuD/methylene tetrahydromethanopterin reductase-like flavin-dependent oxidoreductase (luciferase family)